MDRRLFTMSLLWFKIGINCFDENNLAYSITNICINPNNLFPHTFHRVLVYIKYGKCNFIYIFWMYIIFL